MRALNVVNCGLSRQSFRTPYDRVAYGTTINIRLSCLAAANTAVAHQNENDLRCGLCSVSLRSCRISWGNEFSAAVSVRIMVRPVVPVRVSL